MFTRMFTVYVPLLNQDYSLPDMRRMNWITRSTALAPVAFAAALAAALGSPAIAGAQQDIGSASASDWRIEPTAGIWRQHDRGPATNRRVGQFFGLGFSRQSGTHTQLTASLGYYRLGEALEVLSTAQGQPRTEVYDTELLPISAGVAADLWRGDATAVNLGLELGAVWGRDRLARSSGPEPLAGTPDDDWTPAFLAAPSLRVRRSIGSRLDLTATGRLLLGFGDFSPETIPTVALGLAYQF
jgi:hypothetical protein